MMSTFAIAARDGARWITLAAALAVALVTTFAASSVSAQAVVADTPQSGLDPGDLDKLVARIALYPDDLVALILPASTNPLQIVQADRYLAKRKTDPKLPLDDNWDDSVKSLLNYPEVVKIMSDDLDWTAALGEAVVADQGEVLAAVQAFRRQAEAAGNLKSDPKQTIVVEKEVIKIVPADPQVIYVPTYNPATVVVAGGYPSWGYYPTPYPVYYYPYPPGAAFATGLIWGAAIGAAWNGGHWGANYGGGGNNNININRNTNINTGNINTGNINRGGGQGGGSSQWKANKQPGQVSRSVGATPPARVGDRSAGGAGGGLSSTSARQGAAGPAAGGGGRSGPAGGGGGAATSRPSPTASPATRGGGGGGASAFDGYGSGRQAQMNSSRGAASRSSAAPSPQMSSRGGGAGAARAGGGGGGRAGGGGGRNR